MKKSNNYTPVFPNPSHFLLWTFRTGFVGLCSGVARIGAITGIILGDYNLFHLFAPVLILVGTLALFSSLLVPFLPDMTKHKMAKTYQDIQKVQFSNSSTSPESNVNSVATISPITWTHTWRFQIKRIHIFNFHNNSFLNLFVSHFKYAWFNKRWITCKNWIQLNKSIIINRDLLFQK